jgi:excisionase family DNA binding protein
MVTEMEQSRLLTAKEAAEYLRVSLLTLGKIEKQGGIIPFRTPGGHRRYSMEMIQRYLEGSRSVSLPEHIGVR